MTDPAFARRLAAPSLAGEIAAAAEALGTARSDWRKRRPNHRVAESFPSAEALEAAVAHLSSALFPARLGRFTGAAEGEAAFVAAELAAAVAILQTQIARELSYWEEESAERFDPSQPETIVRLFLTALPEIRGLLDEDVDAAFLADPAARSIDEILISYPGARALLHHRIAHQIDRLGAPLVARTISELANARTGIDIHPGARIGPRFFIDHGTGVVIGETAIIGRGVRLYQHVTLGARTLLDREPARANSASPAIR